MIGTLAALVLVLFVAPLAAEAGRDDPPPVFDRRPYAEARQAAEKDKKWFVVKATAVWCGPCKQMDRTTWRDDKVVKWLEANAVVVALDVDQEKALSKELAIRAMPTMVAFKDGKEFDRIVGYKDAGDFLAWLEGMAKGKKSIEAVRERAAPHEGEKANVQARYDLARELFHSGKTAEAADEYVWLWKNMLAQEPAMYGVRLSFMASDMEQVAEADAGAKAKFATLRDETGKALEGEKVDQNDLLDWVALNRILGEQARTLAWYDKVKDEPRWRPMIRRVSRDLEEIFIKQKRWADVGRLYPEPLKVLEEEQRMLEMLAAHKPPDMPDMPAEMRKEMEETPRRMFRDKVSRIYAGLLAAERETDAEAFAAKARELDPAAGMPLNLASTALQAGQPRRVHLEWLERDASPEAARLHIKVKGELERAPK